MSTNEELVKKGKQLADFQNAKNTLIECRLQAVRYSECLLNLGRLLQDETLSDSTLDNLVADLPTQQAIKQLVGAVRAAQETMRTIQKNLRQVGVEIK